MLRNNNKMMMKFIINWDEEKFGQLVIVLLNKESERIK